MDYKNIYLFKDTMHIKNVMNSHVLSLLFANYGYRYQDNVPEEQIMNHIKNDFLELNYK